VRNLAVAAVLASLPAPVFGAVVVSEIMYDLPGSDQGREWIEIENRGDAPVDLAGWKLLEAGVSHKLVSVGSSIIPPHGYAVIADDAAAFRADWPAFSGVLFSSSFSLNNSGEALALKDASSTPVASAAYSSSLGAGGDGNSLNTESSSWKVLSPSPGASPALSAIVSPPKAQKPAPEARNLPKVGTVRDAQDAKNSGADPHLAAAAGAASAVQGPATAITPSAILPWIGGLLLISAAGTAAVLLGRRRSHSGYEITEEKS
jgi:hypothetical protein